MLNLTHEIFQSDKHQGNKIDSEVNIKLSRKRLFLSDSVKYLGITIDSGLVLCKKLSWYFLNTKERR